MKETLLHSETGSRPTKTKQFIAVLLISLVTFSWGSRRLGGQSRGHRCCQALFHPTGHSQVQNGGVLAAWKAAQEETPALRPTLAIKKHLFEV